MNWNNSSREFMVMISFSVIYVLQIKFINQIMETIQYIVSWFLDMCFQKCASNIYFEDTFYNLFISNIFESNLFESPVCKWNILDGIEVLTSWQGRRNSLEQLKRDYQFRLDCLSLTRVKETILIVLFKGAPKQMGLNGWLQPLFQSFKEIRNIFYRSVLVQDVRKILYSFPPIYLQVS